MYVTSKEGLLAISSHWFHHRLPLIATLHPVAFKNLNTLAFTPFTTRLLIMSLSPQSIPVAVGICSLCYAVLSK